MTIGEFDGRAPRLLFGAVIDGNVDLRQVGKDRSDASSE
jgi:hypothetical protein